MTAKEPFKFTQGSRPNSVTVFDREPGGMIYARTWDGDARKGKGNWRLMSLGHRDKPRAKKYATDEAAKLAKGESTVEGTVTLAQVFALYVEHCTPKKVPSKQADDRRRVEMWTRVLGNIDPHKVTKQKWEAFVAARRSGATDPRGNAVAKEEERKIVRTRGVEIDLVWLRSVFTWATEWSVGDDSQKLMRNNPTKGYEIAREKNPRRAVATQDRFEAVRAVCEAHTFEARWTGKRTKQRSYLLELLDIANGTGRRVESICVLRFEDLRLTKTKSAPYGEICWPADVEKTKRETTVPINPEVRAALDRVIADRPGIGRAPLFPAPGDTTVPMSRHLADKWLRAAERAAGVEPLVGKLWHAYRAKFATELKHLPDKDVAAAGGWKSTLTLKLYQQTDTATMLHVVTSRKELREAK